MDIHTIVTPGLAIHTYLLIDQPSQQAIAIDPTRNIEPLVQLLKELHAELILILETHVHADFISGAKELKAYFKNRPQIGCSSLDCSSLGSEAWIPPYADIKICNHQEFRLGQFKLQALHTPGHTPEHLIFVLYQAEKPLSAFTGDLIFSGSVGRPDLLGAKEQETLSKELYESLFHRIQILPNQLELYPAHGAGSLCGKGIMGKKTTTLGYERLHNPFLQKADLQVWTQDLFRDMPKAPAYFQIVKKKNLSANALVAKISQKLAPEQLISFSFDACTFLDIRSPQEFAMAHLENAINIPWSPSFIRWAGEFISYNLPVVIISKNDLTAFEAIKGLQLIGIDQVQGYILADQLSTKQLSTKIASLPTLTAAELRSRLKEWVIIDVRTDEEWNAGHIEGAKHVEINQIISHWDKLPKDKPLAFICGSGYRSSIVASLAQKAGFKNVCNISGGIQAYSSN